MKPQFSQAWASRLIPVLLAAVFLVGCQREPAGGLPPSGPSAAMRSVTVFTWHDYFCPEVCEQFTRDTGVAIEWRYYENLGEMNALLRSEPDAFDVVVLDDMSLAELIELQLLRPLDRAQVGRFGNIDPRYLNQSFDPGNRFSVPYMWGTTLVAYRKDKMPDPEPSWNLLWDERLRGKVLMLNERQDVYSSTMLSLGLPLDSDRPGDIQRCTVRLIEQIEKVDARYTDIITAKEKIKSGECWAFLAYSGDAAVLAAEDENIGYFIPREGAPLWLDSFAVPREAPHLAEAHAFIDYMTRAEAAAGNANFLSYATANLAAREFLDKELLEDPAIYPSEEVLARCGFIPKATSAREELTNRGMKEIFDFVHQRDTALVTAGDATSPGSPVVEAAMGPSTEKGDSKP